MRAGRPIVQHLRRSPDGGRRSRSRRAAQGPLRSRWPFAHLQSAPSGRARVASTIVLSPSSACPFAARWRGRSGSRRERPQLSVSLNPETSPAKRGGQPPTTRPSSAVPCQATHHRTAQHVRPGAGGRELAAPRQRRGQRHAACRCRVTVAPMASRRQKFVDVTVDDRTDGVDRGLARLGRPLREAPMPTGSASSLRTGRGLRRCGLGQLPPDGPLCGRPM